MVAKKALVLFDVDGTLTPSRKTITSEMKTRLKQLRLSCTTGVVGGSDMTKQKEQLGQDALEYFDYNFSENGLEAYKAGVKIGETSIKDYLSNDKINKLVSFVLKYIADLEIPVKRGTFVEFRKGMLNVSPIGRNCSQEERDAFEVYDHEHHIRSDMVKVLQSEFADYKLQYSIGGQISMDIFPPGWDKTYCLKYIKEDEYEEIHFFGDKTHEGGNDYEIFNHPRVIGHTVTSPEHTKEILDELFPVQQ